MPNPDRRELYQRYHSVYADFYAAIAPVMHRLTGLTNIDRG